MGIRKYAIGETYGHMELIEELPSPTTKQRKFRYKCRECGSVRVVWSTKIKSLSEYGCECHSMHRREVTPSTRYGKLKVIQEVDRDNKSRRRVECQCDCGKKCVVYWSALQSGITSSCGCYQKEVMGKLGRLRKIDYGHLTHLHNIYTRYFSKKQDVFKDFIDFKEWSINNGYKDRFVLNRLDTSKPFDKNNCYWGPTKIMKGIRRKDNVYVSHNGQDVRLTDLCDKYNIDREYFYRCFKQLKMSTNDILKIWAKFK